MTCEVQILTFFRNVHALDPNDVAKNNKLVQYFIIPLNEHEVNLNYQWYIQITGTHLHCIFHFRPLKLRRKSLVSFP